MDKYTIAGVAVLAALLPFAARAETQSLTSFFKESNFAALAGTATVLNLEAQAQDGKPSADVNGFDDYFLINGDGKKVVNFDHMLNSKGSVAIPGWMGVARYSNHDISADIQDGYQKVSAKYKNAGAGHVTVYKTLNTAQLVYDYALASTPAATTCHEILYTPATGAMQRGMTVTCTWSLKNFATARHDRSGMLKKH